MSLYFWFAAAVWFVAVCVLFYGTWTVPWRDGECRKLYDEGVRDFRTDQRRNERTKRVGLALLGVSMVMMWSERFFT